MRHIDEVIIHCTATEQGKNYCVQDVRAWHQARGFTNCGYHYLIHLDGTIEAGRPLQEPGAHCLGHNKYSIGIAYVGGLRKGAAADTRTPEQRAAMTNILTLLSHKFNLKRIVGHNHYANKTCPCFQAQVEYSYLIGKKYLEFI